MSLAKCIHKTDHQEEKLSAQPTVQRIVMERQIVAKSVLVHPAGSWDFIVLVLPVNQRVDLNRVSTILGGVDVRLATTAEVREHSDGTSSEIGNVPIFASQFGMQAIVDDSVFRQEEVIFHGQRDEEPVRMKVADFYRFEHPRIATIVQSFQEKQLAL